MHLLTAHVVKNKYIPIDLWKYVCVKIFLNQLEFQSSELFIAEYWKALEQVVKGVILFWKMFLL